MHHYPSYRLEDFYYKSFKEGGVTFDQLGFLYENYINYKNEEYKFLAALQGIDLDKEQSKIQNRNSKPGQSSLRNNNTVPLFGNPEDYQHLTDEEKKEMTEKMMGKHKSWVNKGLPKSVKR